MGHAFYYIYYKAPKDLINRETHQQQLKIFKLVLAFEKIGQVGPRIYELQLLLIIFDISIT